MKTNSNTQSSNRSQLWGKLLSAAFLGALILDVSPLYSQSVLHDIPGDSSIDVFGQDVCFLGDLNMDGFPDFAVSARLDDNNGPDSGSVTVFSGFDSTVIFQVNGPSMGDRIGESIRGGGDVNADGVPDLIVGSGNENTSGFLAGSVRVYSGVDSSILYSYFGQAAYDGIGSSVAIVGDYDGDGYDDFAWSQVVHGAFNNGCVFVYSGLDGALIRTHAPGTGIDFFGSSIANAGDINQDGVPDLVVGASTGGSGPVNASGSARVYSGSDGSLIHTFFGFFTGGLFGRTCDSAGDVDRDGTPDIVVGAALDKSGGSIGGRAYVFSGATGVLLHSLQSTIYEDLFGYDVGRCGDADGDGFDDFLVGAPMTSSSSFQNYGYVHVYSGKTGLLLYSVQGGTYQGFFGGALAGGTDLDGDGFPDFLVAEYESTVNGPSSGRMVAYAVPTLPVLHYELAGYDPNYDLTLEWTGTSGDVQATTGALSCTGGTPGGMGIYAVSFGAAEISFPLGFSLLISLDPLNLAVVGNFGFGFSGDLTFQGTRQFPAAVGLFAHIQFYEFAPQIRASNAVRLELVP